MSRTLEKMAQIPESERGAYLERAWPNLPRSVTYFLRQHGKIAPNQTVGRIEFKYGSLKNVKAESRDGDRYGYFRDQLVAVVYLEGVRDPLKVIVQCLNGTFALEDDLKSLQAVGSHTPIEQFRIARGEGLIHHVDFPTAIALAERHNLPLYRGKKMEEAKKITPAQARELETETDRLQVTVRVFEGDRFDLARGTFTRSPQK